MKSYRSCAALLILTLVAGCGGGGGSSSSSGSGAGAPIPVVSPTSSASTSPTDVAAYTCPTSDSATATSRRSVAASIRHGRMPGRVASPQPQQTTALVAVSYDRATATGSHRLLAASEARAGGTFRTEYDFARLNEITRVLSVPVAHLAQTEAALRAQPGVLRVGITGAKRYSLAVSAPYYTSDPYFEGFTAAQTGGDAATFQQQPLVENANVPGQWGAHKTQLDYAFEYSQPNNGSGFQNVGALGSAAIKIAVIDTGADLTQPDLASKVTLQRCFITNASGTTQSTSNFVTDPDGHGTNVSGIAGAAANNGIGFTGEGGASVLYEYRVNPTPDSGCFTDPPSTTDTTCTATTTDVAAAIDDAVARGVNVISMSLGGDTCTTAGQDPDNQVEGPAVANAIANNVIVVAAAGNGGTSSDTKVTAPGCDSGVIAVGASALADGAPNGSGNSNGSSFAPTEYVAAYSSFGSPGAAFANSGAWGIVAPGGDPIDSSDLDDLHWINNLYTSTPSADNDPTACGQDYGNTGTAAECQTLIAGTSMATPVVAGAAALILAVNNSYQVPSRMKQLLCRTADDISAAHEGCGRLNVYRAMANALGDPVVPAAVKRRP